MNWQPAPPGMYFTSGSPKTCDSLVPLDSCPFDGAGSCPPSTNVTPPSLDVAKPETEIGLSAKPRVSLKPITIFMPVLSTAIASSAWPPDGPSENPSPLQSSSPPIQPSSLGADLTEALKL